MRESRQVGANVKSAPLLLAQGAAEAGDAGARCAREMDATALHRSAARSGTLDHLTSLGPQPPPTRRLSLAA